MESLKTSFEGECEVFELLNSAKNKTDDIVSSPKTTYAQSYNNIAGMLLSEQSMNVAPDLPTGLEKNPRKQWLYNFSIELSQTPLLVYNISKFYCFNGNYHEPYNVYTFYGIISRLLLDAGVTPMADDVRFVVDNLKAIVPSKPYTAHANHPDYFLYANGLVNVHTGQFQSIDPYYFATGAIAADFNPLRADCHPEFNKFLNRITKGDVVLIQRIWEVLAYAVSPEYRQRIIFCLIGVGGAGKSVLLKVIQELLAPSLVTNMSMADLASRGFSESELENKRICIASDEGKFNFNEDSASKLKRISGGGETITVDVKMKAQTTFVVTAKLLVASNYPIHRSAAAIDPYLRKRMMIIPFTHTIPINEQDPNLLGKILDERDAIATKAFYVYRQLMHKNFLFSGDETYYEGLANAATASTSCETVRIFSDMYCDFDGISFISTEDLFEAYNIAFPTVPFKDSSSFSKAFFDTNYGRVKHQRKHISQTNHRGFCGVTLKGELT